MKKSFSCLIGFVIILFAIIPNTGNAQKGSIKIFSELKGVNVYLDDVLKGTDVILLDSITVGSHYLKVIKEEVIIYGELISVNANTATTVLVKNSKEVQDKILASKFKEQEEYKSRRLDVLLDTKYITETTGNTESKANTQSLYFPGYYSVMGSAKTTVNTQTNTVSVTHAVTDWFITKGTKRISPIEFGQLIDDTFSINNFERGNIALQKEDLKKAKKRRAQKFIWGAIATATGAVMINKADFSFSEWDGHKVGPLLLSIVGIEVVITGSVLLINGATKPLSKYNFNDTREFNYTFESAVAQAKLYNQNLKKELGLPENYEPI